MFIVNSLTILTDEYATLPETTRPTFICRYMMPSNLSVSYGATSVEPGQVLTETTAGVWEKSFPSPEFLGVSYSDHPYFVFNEADLKKNDEQRVATICGMKDYYARANSFNPVLLDEFTAAITDCTNFLNGQSPSHVSTTSPRHPLVNLLPEN